MMNQLPNPTGLAFSIFPLIFFGPLIIFFLIFLVKFLKTRQKMFLHLTLLFMISGLAQALSAASTIIPFFNVGSVLFLIGQILDLASLLLLLVIFESFNENKVLSWQLLLFAIMTSLIVGGLLSSPEIIITTEQGFTSYQFEQRTFNSMMVFAYGLFVTIWLLKTFVKMRRTATNSQQKSLVTWLVIGIFLSQIVGSFAPVTFELIPSSIIELRMIGSNLAIFKAIGMLIVGVIFYRVSKQPWLLQRQRVQLLLVYSKAGIPMYNKIFDENMSEADVQLFTGAMTAISTIFNESTKSKDSIQSITFKGKEIRIIDRSHFITVLMADYHSQASESALENFVKDFESKFSIEIPSLSGIQTPFTATDDIADT